MTRALKVVCLSLLTPLAACDAEDTSAPTPIQQDADIVPVADAQSSTVSRQKWRGGSADAYASSEYAYAYVSAFEDVSGKSRSTFIDLWSYSYDPNSEVCTDETYCWDPSDPSTCYTYTWCYYEDYSHTYAWGSVNSNGFSVGKKGARLNVDLAANPGLYGETCTPTGCTPATGSIDLTWAADGRYTSQSNGHSSYSYNFGGVSYTSKSTGQWSSSSATLSGTILGIPANNGGGGISESKGQGVTREIIKG